MGTIKKGIEIMRQSYTYKKKKDERQKCDNDYHNRVG